jgi:hypothetical protein
MDKIPEGCILSDAASHILKINKPMKSFFLLITVLVLATTGCIFRGDRDYRDHPRDGDHDEHSAGVDHGEHPGDMDHEDGR